MDFKLSNVKSYRLTPFQVHTWNAHNCTELDKCSVAGPYLVTEQAHLLVHHKGNLPLCTAPFSR